MAERATERFCAYVDTFRRTALTSESSGVRESLDALCACLEAKGADAGVSQSLLPELDDLQILLTTCELGAHRESACREFFEKVDRVTDACRLS